MLSSSQQGVVKDILEKYNVFYTGVAGTGKTFLTRHLIELLEKDLGPNALGITSTTGLSAIQVGGTTIFRLFKMSPLDLQTSPDKLAKRNKRLKDLRVLFIDEISMISPILFTLIDNVLQVVKRNTNAFGGVQVIVSGDFYQLECPKETQHVFETKSWSRLNFRVHTLKKNYRQSDTRFTSALAKLRNGGDVSDAKELFKSPSDFDPDFLDTFVRIFSRNAQADKLNKQKLDEINSDPMSFDLNVKTLRRTSLSSSGNVQQTVTLKVGARVMLLVNLSPEDGLVNGSLGTVKNLFKSGPVVKFDNGRLVEIEPHEYKIRENGVTYKFTQVPLRLAWGMTIHKSQGQTIERLWVDCKGIFTFGQLYVAISRATTLDTLAVESFPTYVPMVPETVSSFYGRNNE